MRITLNVSLIPTHTIVIQVGMFMIPAMYGGGGSLTLSLKMYYLSHAFTITLCRGGGIGRRSRFRIE